MISLIATVLNEGETIAPLLDSILAQTRLPDEVVIVDGGSDDDTIAILEQYADKLPLRVIVEESCNISRGRNLAIQAASGDIIAATDAGVRLDKAWLEQIAAPLLQDASVDVVSGFFRADPQSLFELALAAVTLPLPDEIEPRKFLPSSRSIAFRKSAALRVGGYPEWLDYCEDLIFDLRLRACGARFVFADGAIARFRPRTSLQAYWRQYYLYARGDGKADLWRKRHAARYTVYLALAPGIGFCGALIHPALWLGWPLAGALYLRRPYMRLPALMRLAGRKSAPTRLACALLIPLLRLVGDLAKMAGYIAGLRWRLRDSPADWRASAKCANMDTDKV